MNTLHSIRARSCKEKTNNKISPILLLVPHTTTGAEVMNYNYDIIENLLLEV